MDLLQSLGCTDLDVIYKPDFKQLIRLLLAFFVEGRLHVFHPLGKNVRFFARNQGKNCVQAAFIQYIGIVIFAVFCF